MLKDLLEDKGSAIVERWAELIFKTYPADTSKFLGGQPNRFANPVGSNVLDAVDKLYSWLLQGIDTPSPEVRLALDNIVRIRAVQEFSPGHAVGFIFLLKKAVREILGPENRQNGWSEDLLTFESRIDNLALLAFDIYTQCREKIFEIRATEIRDRTSRILERACQKYGMPHEW